MGTGTAHTTAWTMTSGSNKVASWKFGTGASIPWTTDGQGNLVNDGAGQTFAYDAKNRLVSSTTASGTTTYAYDATGQRTRKAGPLGTEQYVYDEAGRLLGVYDGSGTLLEELVYLDGFRPVATVRLVAGSPTVYPVLTDHRGTPRVVLDPSTGSAVWTWDATEPFGNQAPVAVGGFTFHGRFPGQRFDPESGLVNNGFRTYSTAAGRYVQSDPMGLAAGWNTFGYALGAPTVNTDYSGLIIDNENDFQVKIAFESVSRSEAGRMALAVARADPRHLFINVSEIDGAGTGYNHVADDNGAGTDVVRTINWNPTVALQKNGSFEKHNMLFPDIVLLHEIGHFNQGSDPERAKKLRAQNDPSFDNCLEKENILGLENSVAKDLGELVRTSHHVKSNQPGKPSWNVHYVHVDQITP